MRADTARDRSWMPVCRVEQLRLELGVAALVGGEQVAVFRVGVEEIRAIGNLDPYSKANVLSRGIVGSRGETLFVASPMYKQPFDLRTGHCLDDREVRVPTFEVRVIDGVVEVLGAKHSAVAPDKAEPTESTDVTEATDVTETPGR